MRNLILSCLLVPLTLIGQKSTEYYQDTLDFSMTWEVDTVIITGNLYVPVHVTLTIDPGVKVLVQKDYFIQVEGHLKAIGARDKPIVFRAVDTLGFWDTLSIPTWQGIIFEQDPPDKDSSILHYCQIGYSRGLPDKSSPGSGLRLRSRDRIRISSSDIYNNHSLQDGGGIACYKSSPLIRDNKIWNNRANMNGGGIMFHECQAPRLIANEIRSNTSRIKGGGICCLDSKVLILRNQIIYNRCSNQIYGGTVSTGDGGGIYSSSENEGPRVIHNKIINNTAPGAALHIECTSSEIIGNIIANNANVGVTTGGFGLDSKYINNTICSNLGVGVMIFTPFQLWCNNIIWGNGYAPTVTNVVYLGMSPSMSYSLVGGGYFGSGNISADPNFIQPCLNKGVHPSAVLANWKLMSSSPCIDKGRPDTSNLSLLKTDLSGSMRVLGGRIDMGALEAEVSQDMAVHSQQHTWGLHPNPAYGTPVFFGQDMEEYTILVYDLLGLAVYKGTHRHHDNVPLDRLRPGVYVYRILREGEVLHSSKWIKEK